MASGLVPNDCESRPIEKSCQATENSTATHKSQTNELHSKNDEISTTENCLSSDINMLASSQTKANCHSNMNSTDKSAINLPFTVQSNIGHTITSQLLDQNMTSNPLDSTLLNEPAILVDPSQHRVETDSNSDKSCLFSGEDVVQAVSKACFYVNGKLGHISGRFLVDTGSSICVISDRVYSSLGNDKPLMPTSRRVRMADGRFLKLKGLCTLEIQLDHLTFSQEFVVAEIEEPIGILGINFLDSYESDIKIKKKILKTKLGKIKLHRQGSDGCNRLQLCENVTLPAYSESFVPTYMSQTSCSTLNIMEPTKCYIDKGLLIARTLVDTSQPKMVISLLNCSNKSVKMRQNVTLGMVHPIDQLSVLNAHLANQANSLVKTECGQIENDIDSQIGNQLVVSELDSSQVSENGNKLVKRELVSSDTTEKENKIVSSEPIGSYDSQIGNKIVFSELDGSQAENGNKLVKKELVSSDITKKGNKIVSTEPIGSYDSQIGNKIVFSELDGSQVENGNKLVKRELVSSDITEKGNKIVSTEPIGSYDSQIGNKIVFSELDGSQVENGNKLVKRELVSSDITEKGNKIVKTEPIGSYDSQIENKIVISELDSSQVSENGNKLVKMELFSTGNLQEESRLVSTELSELYCRENGKCISSGENDSYIVTTNISECEETNYIQSCTKGLPEYLLPLVENASPSLTDNEKGRLADLITEFSDVFMSPNGQLSQTDLAEHYIDTGDTKPFKTPCHRLPLFKKPIVEAEIKKMLEQKVIEPSVSPWNSPICLVAKKSGEWRFCVDLRALNSVTKLDTYPLPRIDETLDQLSNSKYFSTLDMASGYWQLNLSPQDRDKTSFAIPGVGTFRFRVMCFGLKNAPSSFSRLMEIVLRGLQFDKCLVYLDDIIVMGENFDSALENLKLVLLRFREANLKLKVSKCKLFQKEVVFLGHQVSEAGITCDPQKTKIIKHWPRPSDKTEIKQFLGLVNYYRKMVPEFSEIAIPLSRLTKKRAQFEWGQEQEAAFEKLKQCLTGPPILSFPLETGGSFVLDCDASAHAIGGILSQYQSNVERVIAYGSHTLNSAQQNYCTTKRELYSIVYFVQHFKHYLLGRKFILRTDHASLLWLCNFKEPTGILARWISILGAYDYDTVFRPGHLHSNVDTMTRRPKRLCPYPNCKDCQPNSLENNMPSGTNTLLNSDEVSPLNTLNEDQSDNSDILPNWLNVWSREDLKELQHQDPCILEIINLKHQHQQKPPKSEIAQIHKDIQTFVNQWELLKIYRELLYREIEDDTGILRTQLVAPKEIRDVIFTHLHEQRYAAHLGRDRTISAVKRRFYWPGMNDDIAQWCKECQLCSRCKPGPGKGKSALEQFKVFRPMSVVGIDILGPLNQSYSNNQFILVVGCYFTKWKEAFAIPNHTSAIVADKLVQEVFLRFGFPAQIHSDQGKEFESQLFKEICSLLGVEKTRTCAYRPQSDGLIERFNRTLISMLSMFVDQNQQDWDDHLPYVMAAYRATQHKSTGVTPNLLMLNREIDCPIDLMVGPPPSYQQTECPIRYIEWVKSAMSGAFEFTHQQLGLAASRQKRDYNRGLKPREFKEGDWVWRWYPPTANQKLGLGWVGPYLIVKRLSYLTYRIQKSEDSRPLVVHVDHLKPFAGTKHPRNWLHRNTETENLPVNEPEHEPIPSREPDSPVLIRTRRGRQVKPREIYSPS